MIMSICFSVDLCSGPDQPVLTSDMWAIESDKLIGNYGRASAEKKFCHLRDEAPRS
jgi:hypothetical protein